MPEVAFDESGNTGADLLNPAQPVFTLASTSVSIQLADKLLNKVRTPQTGEVKFSQLRRYKSGQRRIIDLLQSPELNSSNICITHFHKRFMVVTKIVDVLIETVAHDSGYDLYKDGANIAMSNMHFYCMPVFCGEESTNKFLTSFVKMIRHPSEKSVAEFYQLAENLADSCRDEDYTADLMPILMSKSYIAEILAGNNRNSLDPAIPGFVQHCSVWGERFGASFDLVHDDSKPIFQEKEMLENLMSRGEEERVLGYDRRAFVFPLRANGVKFGSSADDPRIQLADLIASASCTWASGLAVPPGDQSFFDQLVRADLLRFAHDSVWPSPHVSPEDLQTVSDGQGVNPADGIAEYLAEHRKPQ